MLDKLRDDGYRLVGLEQTTNSRNLHEYEFARRTALVIGNERTGLTEDILAMLDDVVEIPVWGLPYSYNVATATTMALYEYCRAVPEPASRRCCRRRHDERPADDLAGQNFSHALRQLVERGFRRRGRRVARCATGRRVSATFRAAAAADIWPSRCRRASRRAE